MCGIAGIISFREKIDVQLINKMTDVINHRGPDDEGALMINSKEKSFREFRRSDEHRKEFMQEDIYFGHRRLSIIDLSRDGHQPMSYDDENLWITYNGEIYNYIELREELSDYGYKFRSKTDTEVILAAYHKWGEDCLNKFNGMWSFAIYDRRKNIIFCAVDQFGIKPFYYYNTNEIFCFGSEIKQIFALPFIKREFNSNIISAFGYGLVKSNSNTIYSGINKLNAGEKIIINLEKQNEVIQISKWHRFDTQPLNDEISVEKASEIIKDLFYDSVKLRLRSDVPVGTALSGGIDSSIIVLIIDDILNKSTNRKIQKTFTAGSEDITIDETKFAKEVLKETKAEGYFVEPNSSGFTEEFEKMYYHIEKPFVSSTCYASWSVYRLAKENGVTVTLDGQGSDEIFAGYDAYMYPYYQFDFFTNFKWTYLRQNANEIVRLHGISKTKQIQQMFQKYLKSRGIISQYYDKKRIKYDNLFDGSFSTKLLKNVEFIKTRKKSIGTFSKNLEFYLYDSLPQLLNVVDKNSMAHSVEARVPFLDYRLVEFVYSMPHEFKIMNGITKYILKKAFIEIIPEQILNRKKEGFNTAENLWFLQQKGKLREFVNDNYNSVKNIFSKEYVENLFSNANLDLFSQKRRWDVLSIITLAKVFKINQ